LPRLSCWFIRASLVYLLLGFSFGSLLLANKGIVFYPSLWRLLPSHMEFLLIGWMVQLVFGVAFWILPRFGEGSPRGKESLVWGAWSLLNLGIWLVVMQPVFNQAWFSLIGRVSEMAGVLAFVFVIWKRVKPFNKHKREI